ncbi:hypothetical protein CUMW_184800 [Citrus unshiu]|uniref:CRM domain-containing protein n=2 Tax=Citrus TaxID=2706 RepID=A0A2H5Q0I5_CITUN|nr:hypothetical protein CUMW_184800 [Citrus unshiu]
MKFQKYRVLWLNHEELFSYKKMAQKRSSCLPSGRRRVFGGVILNMHMHWKKHEIVKVFCKPSKPGQINEFAEEIARLSVPPPGVDVWLPSDSLGTAFPQVDIEDAGLSTSESDHEDDSLSIFPLKNA